MGVFVDKKYENLDWISAATEPMESVLNDVLGLLPDSYDISYDTYREIIGESWTTSIGVTGAVRLIAKKIAAIDPDQQKIMSKISSFSWHQTNKLMSCFQFQVEGNPIMDCTQQIIYGGTLKVIKVVNTLDEKILGDLLGKGGIDVVKGHYLNTSEISRTNEIMELLGSCEEGLKTRSLRTKKRVLVNRLQNLFKNNEWNIKDTELADKVGSWIIDYIYKGDLSALSNFCRLKVMTHKGNPIYSMEEVK